ncbi:MAG: 3',5'-cyclic-nucleotide phosphodiesterase [Woeseia sp.]
MQIRVLGCSGGIGGATRTSAMLIDDDVLIDAGTGIGDLALVDLKKIRHVFLTHAHLDHIAGLPLLIDAIYEDDLAEPLVVYARPETIQALRDHIFNNVIWPDFGELPNAARPVLQYRVCSPGDSVQVTSRKFKAVDVSHTVPSQGYTVQNGGGTFAVSGDTRTNQTLWPVLNASDDLRALVIEVSFPDELRELADVSGHYCPATLVSDLAKLAHEPDIWLTGMKPGEEDTIFRQVRECLPDRRINMLSRGVTISV